MKTFLATLVFSFVLLQSQAQTLIRWDFEREDGTHTLFPTFISDTSAMDVNDVRYSALYPLDGNAVPGVSGQPFDWADAVRGWYPDSSIHTYIWTWIEFRFFVDSDFVASVDSISLWYKRDMVGPTRFDFRSHKDLYGSAIDAILLDELDVSWHKWSIPVSPFLVNGYEQVTFRIYGDGAPSHNEGYFTIDSVAIYGSIFRAQPLNLRAYLGGPFSESLPPQKDDLRSLGFLPIIDPYGSGKITTPEVLAISDDNAIVDWVLVEIRSADDSANVVSSVSALLQKDGDIVNVDGVSSPVVGLDSGQYYIAVRHRNHLGVMTASAINLSGGASTIDFTSTATATYGSSAQVQVGTKMLLWAGDATGNGTIKYTGSGNDRDPIILAIGGTTPNNTVSNVYDRRDTNLDGVIKYTGSGNDRDIILTNVGSTTPNNTRTQQLP